MIHFAVPLYSLRLPLLYDTPCVLPDTAVRVRSRRSVPFHTLC